MCGKEETSLSCQQDQRDLIKWSRQKFPWKLLLVLCICKGQSLFKSAVSMYILIMSVICEWIWLWSMVAWQLVGKPECLWENLFHCQFICHGFHMDCTLVLRSDVIISSKPVRSVWREVTGTVSVTQGRDEVFIVLWVILGRLGFLVVLCFIYRVNICQTCVHCSFWVKILILTSVVISAIT